MKTFRLRTASLHQAMIVGIHASGILISLSLLMLNSYVVRLFDRACVPMWITINTLYLALKRIVSGVVSVI